MTAKIIDFSKPNRNSDWSLKTTVEMDFTLTGLPYNATEADVNEEFSKFLCLIEEYMSGYKLSLNQGMLQADRLEEYKK